MSSESLRARLDGAPPGPWHWSGHRKGGMYLAFWRPGWGRCTVMDFARHGMRDAQPRFPTDNQLMIAAKDLAVQEVPYRDDIVDINHPVASLIVHAPTDLRLALDVVEAAKAGQFLCSQIPEGSMLKSGAEWPRCGQCKPCLLNAAIDTFEAAS